MAESTILRSSASPRNASPTSASPAARLSGPLPVVNVLMGSGGPSQAQGGAARSNVHVGPVRGGITRDGKVIAPQLAPPNVTAGGGLSPEQLGFCRFLVDAYVKAESEKTEDVNEENLQIARDTLASLDAALKPAPVRRVVSPGARPNGALASAAPRRIAAPRTPPAPVVVDMDEAPPPQE